MISALMSVAICAALIWGWESENPKSFYRNQGKVFGTYFSIQYEAGRDLLDSIQAAFCAFDNSLSMFNPNSTLSAINANRDTLTDEYFESM